jgi:phage host-nuclease inhibitor protein Gam
MWQDILMIVVPAIVGLIGGKYLTGREKQSADVAAREALMTQIKGLIDQNKELLDRYLAEQEKNLSLISEINDLTAQVTNLKTEVKGLKNQLAKFIKTEKIKENE